MAEANDALAQARLDKTRIRAPFAGIVGRRRVSPGAYLQAGDVITDLARVDRMKCRFAAPERYARLDQRGAGRRSPTRPIPAETFTGRVNVVDPSSTPPPAPSA